jgi:hypothetical protein
LPVYDRALRQVFGKSSKKCGEGSSEANAEKKKRLFFFAVTAEAVVIWERTADRCNLSRGKAHARFQ